MVATKNAYEELLPSMDCSRPRGGNCTGNCRKSPSQQDCLRPIGGKCVGNCRKSENPDTIKW